MRALSLGRMNQVVLKARRQPITGIVDQLVGIITKDRYFQVSPRMDVNCEVYVAHHLAIKITVLSIGTFCTLDSQIFTLQKQTQQLILIEKAQPMKLMAI